MSAKWFKVETDLVDHPKVDQLSRLTGENLAGWYLLRLWSWVSRFCPTGHISGHLKVSLEDALGWHGENGLLLESMVVAEFLDEEQNGDLYVHDWAEYQSQVSETAIKERERKREYRAKLRARIVPDLSHGTGVGTLTGQIPTGRDVTGRDNTKRDKKKPMSAEADPRVREVFDHWVSVMSVARAVLSPKRLKAVASRLDDGYTPENLKAAVDGCSKTPHNMGQNDRGTKFNDLELICRSPENVDRFMSATGPQAPKPTHDPNSGISPENRWVPGMPEYSGDM